MKILHVSNDQYPAVMGGTEIFVARLVDAQTQRRDVVEVKWASHAKPTQRQTDHPSMQPPAGQVLLPPVQLGSRLDSFCARSAAIPGFNELLEEFRPDIVHMHSMSVYSGIQHAKAAKSAGAHLVVTIHTPGYSCATGTLIDMNGSICDGRLRPRRCTSCRLQGAGLGRPIAALASVQRGRGLSTESTNMLARVATFRSMIEEFHDSWLELASTADALHVHADWLVDVLKRHSIPSSKVHRVGTAGPARLPAPIRKPLEDGVLRIVYWGRTNPVKGIHLVAEAVRSMDRDVPVAFDIYTNRWDSTYGRQLADLIGADDRIRARDPLSAHEMILTLQNYDLAVVPSTWLETGPLTVLEAFAAGIPVAGSPLGGIAEKLEGVPGTFLVETTSRAWAEFLGELIRNPESLELFRPPPSRTFDDVAKELMETAYKIA